MNNHNIIFLTNNCNYSKQYIKQFLCFNHLIIVDDSIFDNSFNNINCLLNQILECDVLIIDNQNYISNNKLLAYISGFVKCLNTTTTHHIKTILINGSNYPLDNKCDYSYIAEDIYDTTDYINQIIL